MEGPPIQAVNEGLRIFGKIISTNPACLESVYVSVIKFDSSATQLTPLTEAAQFSAPALSAGGGTALSAGFSALREAIQREFRPKSGDQLGDYKPLIFIFTDGQPNPGDKWKNELDLLNEQKGRRPGKIVAIGAGPAVDVNMLREVSPEDTYILADLDGSKITSLFAWIANSTVRATNTVNQANPTVGATLAPAPPNLFATKP